MFFGRKSWWAVGNIDPTLIFSKKKPKTDRILALMSSMSMKVD